MTLKELRKVVKMTECLDEDVDVNINFCGYITDGDYISSVKWSYDGDAEFVDIQVECTDDGEAYKYNDYAIPQSNCETPQQNCG